jgi:hypothetical protein
MNYQQKYLKYKKKYLDLKYLDFKGAGSDDAAKPGAAVRPVVASAASSVAAPVFAAAAPASSVAAPVSSVAAPASSVAAPVFAAAAPASAAASSVAVPGSTAAAAAALGLRLTDPVPINDSVVRVSMQLFRSNPELMEKLDLSVDPPIVGREMLPFGMNIMKYLLRFKKKPALCPVGRDYIVIWLKHFDGDPSVEAGFEPNRFETWADLLEGTINAVHQVETQTDYP